MKVFSLFSTNMRCLFVGERCQGGPFVAFVPRGDQQFYVENFETFKMISSNFAKEADAFTL